MFCLDPVKQQAQRLNPTGCACMIQAHESCLHAWYHQKQQIECPICHTVANPNPIVIYVQQPVVEQQAERVYRRNEKAIAVCCCMLIFWAISLTILEFIFRD